MYHKVMLLQKGETGKGKKYITYRVGCACMDPEDDVWIDVEATEHQTVEVSFYASLVHPYWYDYDSKLDFVASLLRRFKAALKLIFTGDLKVETTLMLMGDEHVDSFVKCIKDGVKFVKNK